MDLESELREIGALMDSAEMLASVRQEVSKVAQQGFVVTDGSHDESDYDVVVRCGSDENKVARRLGEKIPDADMSKIAEGVLGLNRSRRARNGD